MIPKRHLTSVVLALMVAASVLLIVLLWPSDPRQVVEIGFLMGTLLGQVSLAAAWVALGPGHWMWRGPLSCLWLAGLLVANAVGGNLRNRADYDFLVIVSSSIIVQWLAVQAVLWGLAYGYGLRVRRWDQVSTATSGASQFGIGQLMVLTGIVALMLGIGRLIVSTWTLRLDEDWLVFAFLVVAAILMALPTLLACLIPRFAVPAVILVLIVSAVATAWEAPLLSSFSSGGPNQHHLIWINVFTLGWVIVIMAVLRLGGYGLALPAAGSNNSNSLSSASLSQANRP